MGNDKASCPQRLNNIETFGEARQWQIRAHSRRSRQRVERATIVLALRGRLHDGDPMESERMLNFAVFGHQRIRFLAPRFARQAETAHRRYACGNRRRLPVLRSFSKRLRVLRSSPAARRAESAPTW